MLERYHRTNVHPFQGSTVDPTPADKNYVHIWSSRQDIVDLRRVFACQWMLGYIPLWIIIFVMCAFYFGAGADPYSNAHNIAVSIVDFDQGEAGNILMEVFQNTPPGNLTLHWQFKTSKDYDGHVENVEQAVTDGTVWAAVILRPNVSSMVAETLSSLVKVEELLAYPFAHTLPIKVIYEEGRNVFAHNNFILPPIRSAIATANQFYAELLQLRVISVLSSNANSSINRTVQRQNIVRLSHLLADPLPAEFFNVHPAYPFVGQFATTLGYIYLFLVSMIIVGSTIGGIAPFANKIHYGYLVLFRSLNGIFQSFMISLIYSLIVLWFFGINSGQQFIRYWMFNWLSTLVLATIVAFFMSNLGPPGTIFIIAFVVVMVSAATIQIPLELSPRFFRYGYGMPLYHSMNGGRHLLFGSYSNFSVDVGVLVAYFGVLMLLTILSVIFWTKKQNKKSEFDTNTQHTDKL